MRSEPQLTGSGWLPLRSRHACPQGCSRFRSPISGSISGSTLTDSAITSRGFPASTRRRCSPPAVRASSSPYRWPKSPRSSALPRRPPAICRLSPVARTARSSPSTCAWCGGGRSERFAAAPALCDRCVAGEPLPHVKAVCEATAPGVIVQNRANSLLRPETVTRLLDACPDLIGFKDGTGRIGMVREITARAGDRLCCVGGIPRHELPRRHCSGSE